MTPDPSFEAIFSSPDLFCCSSDVNLLISHLLTSKSASLQPYPGGTLTGDSVVLLGDLNTQVGSHSQTCSTTPSDSASAPADQLQSFFALLSAQQTEFLRSGEVGPAGHRLCVYVKVSWCRDAVGLSKHSWSLPSLCFSSVGHSFYVHSAGGCLHPSRLKQQQKERSSK